MARTLQLFCFLICLVNLIQSDLIAQNWTCETEEPEKEILEKLRIESYNRTMDQVTLSIYIHIIRDNNGNGGLSETAVNNAISVLNDDYENDNVYFKELGRDEIHDDDYYNFSSPDFGNLIGVNSHENAIDIYFLTSGINYGRASGIPGIAIVLGGSYAGTSVLSHEMGHCIGLYHTHSGSGCNDNANCAESPDGSNCDDCGDLVCDTPADPCLAGEVDESCVYTGDNTYNPDVENILSYTRPECMEHLTEGQYSRAFTVIENDPQLQDVTIPNAPTNLTWSEYNEHPLLSWTASEDPPEIYRYRVYRLGSDPNFYYVYPPTTSYLDVDVTVSQYGTDIHYHIKAETESQLLSDPSNEVTVHGYTGKIIMADYSFLPSTFNLYDNHPNPFNPSTIIRYDLPVPSFVTITVFDFLGREVVTLSSSFEEVGYKSVIWNGTNKNGKPVASGMYIYKLTAISMKNEEKFTKSQKMVLLR